MHSVSVPCPVNKNNMMSQYSTDRKESRNILHGVAGEIMLRVGKPLPGKQ